MSALARASIFSDRSSPSTWAAPSLRALYGQRAGLIPAVDAALPDAFLPSFDGYLRSLGPLQDDGTVTTLLQRSGDLLSGLSKDQALATALVIGRLGTVPAAAHQIAINVSSLCFMLPMALALEEGGDGTMGRSIIGGVLSSTVLTLVVVPVIYAMIEEFKARRAARRAARTPSVSLVGAAGQMPAE